MKLISCHIENFGKLSDFSMDFSDGLNVIAKPNGWGKSTLAAFLRIMFWGFSDDRSRDELVNERKRYKPWQSGVYGGKVCFETNGRQYVLTRIFGTSKKEDLFELRDFNTNLICTDFTEKIGEEIWGIDAAAFVRTIHISQNDCFTEVNGSINAKIGNLVEDTDDINSYEAADERLKNFINEYSDTRKTGRLFRQKEEIARIKAEISDENEIRNIRKETIAYREKEVNNKEDIMCVIGDIYEKQKLRAGLDALNSEIERYRLTEDELCEVDKKIPDEHELSVLSESVQKLSECVTELSQHSLIATANEFSAQLRKWRFIFAAMAAAAAAVFLIFQKFIPAGIFFAVFIVMLVWAIRTISIKSEDEGDLIRKRDELTKNIENSLSEYFDEDISKDYQEYIEILRKRMSTVKLLSDKRAKYLDALSQRDKLYRDEIPTAKEIEDEFFSLNKELEKTIQRINGLDRRMDECNERISGIDAQKTELNELTEEYTRMKHKLGLCEAARKMLADAKHNFTASYTKPVLAAFRKYYSYYCTDGDDYELDAKLSLSMEKYGEQRNPGALSRGYCDIVGVCMRLALFDVMYPDERPYMVWDDPFVNLDSDNQKKAYKLLVDVKKDRQIIFLTCKEKILDTI